MNISILGYTYLTAVPSYKLKDILLIKQITPYSQYNIKLEFWIFI